MSVIDFNQLFRLLLTGVKKIAKEHMEDYLEDAISSGTGALYELKDNLKIWTAQLEAGEIGKEDLEWNILSAMDTVEMIALKQAGLLQIQVDRFKTALSSLISETLRTIIP
jgi:hypothetical protein